MKRALKRRHPRDDKLEAGFTLIETLIATALMMAILGALATVTAQWLPNWNRGLTRVQRSEEVTLGLERIVADLAAAEVIPAHREAKVPLFDGAELSVIFVRTAIGPNATRGLEIIRLAEVPDAGNLALVRAAMPFTPLPPEGSVASYLRFRDPVVLVRAPYRITFAYAGSDRTWRNSWSGANELPRMIRVTVRDAATHQTLSMSTATMVHAQVAAECVRAKASANCNKKQAPAQ